MATRRDDAADLSKLDGELNSEGSYMRTVALAAPMFTTAVLTVALSANLQEQGTTAIICLLALPFLYAFYRLLRQSVRIIRRNAAARKYRYEIALPQGRGPVGQPVGRREAGLGAGSAWRATVTGRPMGSPAAHESPFGVPCRQE